MLACDVEMGSQTTYITRIFPPIVLPSLEDSAQKSLDTLPWTVTGCDYLGSTG